MVASVKNLSEAVKRGKRDTFDVRKCNFTLFRVNLMASFGQQQFNYAPYHKNLIVRLRTAYGWHWSFNLATEFQLLKGFLMINNSLWMNVGLSLPLKWIYYSLGWDILLWTQIRCTIEWQETGNKKKKYDLFNQFTYRKKPALSRSLTHDPLITRLVLYRCAPTNAKRDCCLQLAKGFSSSKTKKNWLLGRALQHVKPLVGHCGFESVCGCFTKSIP